MASAEPARPAELPQLDLFPSRLGVPGANRLSCVESRLMTDGAGM